MNKAKRELEEILHINGCQQYALGWNNALSDEDDNKHMEQLEKVALKEVWKWYKKWSK